MAKPSGMLQAVCIFAIVLGVLGIWTGIFGVVNAATGGRFQGAVGSVGGYGMTPEQAETQRQFLQDMRDVTARWSTVTTPLLILELVVSVGMIVGAVGVLRGRSGGRKLLGRVFALAIVLELVQLVPAMAMQYEIGEITPTFVEQSIVTAAPPGKQLPPELQATATTVAKATVIVGLVFGAAMKLLEVGFYVFGYVFLRRSAVPPGPRPLVAEVVGR